MARSVSPTDTDNHETRSGGRVVGEEKRLLEIELTVACGSITCDGVPDRVLGLCDQVA